MTLWCRTLWVLCREAARAVVAPVRTIWWLWGRERSRAAAREALAAAAQEAAGDPLAGFLARAPSRPPEHPHIFVSAGEASGEAHGARLVDAARRQGLDGRWSCFGGTHLEAQGAALLFSLSEHAVMGLLGVFRALPLILRAYHRFLRLLEEDRPDLVVLIDYPGLHLVMAEAAGRKGIPVLHYIAPQYWAWAPWRMARYRRAVDGTLTILPFEVAFFERARIAARYVGHPLLDTLAADPPDPATLAAVRARPTLVLLPGSRRAEIRANLPGLITVARDLQRSHPDLRAVVVHRDPRREDMLREILAVAPNGAPELHLGHLAPWLEGARLVLAKSGTGSLEAVLHGTPTVVVYRLRGPLASLFVRHFLSVPWVASANLIAGREVVPEFLFRVAAGWQPVRTAAETLWRDGPERERCIMGIAEVNERLGSPGASDRAAAVLCRFFGREQ